MSISVVNGYLCENSCDVAKAQKGEDPHPKIGSELGKTDGKPQPGVSASARVDGPAVVLGGALAMTSNNSAVGDPPPATPITSAPPMAYGQALDILA
jgi:hypothetical protein